MERPARANGLLSPALSSLGEGEGREYVGEKLFAPIMISKDETFSIEPAAVNK